MRRKHLFRSSYQDSDFCYSLFSGSSLYLYCDYLEHEVFPAFIDDNKNCPEIITPDGKCYCWIKRIRYIDDSFTDKDIGVQRHYLYMIKNRPAFDRVLWPVDVIEVSEDIINLEGKAMTVSRHHDARDDSNQVDVSNLALVFPYEDRFQSFKYTAKDIVDYYKRSGLRAAEENSLTYKNPVIRKLMVEIVKAIKGLYDSGYLYYDFSLPRFTVDQTGACLYLDFSNLIYGIDEIERAESLSYLMIEEPKEIELDFADPYFATHDEMLLPDEQSFLVSLCSLLFYLMFGRNAYDGGDSAENDESLLRHYRIALSRLENPFFIFDEDSKNNVNKLGAITAHRTVIDLFENSDPQIQSVFKKTLSYGNVMRMNEYMYAPSLDDWMSFFESNGWLSESANVKLIIPENR